MGFMPASVLQLANWAGHAGWAATAFAAGAFAAGALATGLTGGLGGAGVLAAEAGAAACAITMVGVRLTHNSAAMVNVKVVNKFFKAISAVTTDHQNKGKPCWH